MQSSDFYIAAQISSRKHFLAITKAFSRARVPKWCNAFSRSIRTNTRRSSPPSNSSGSARRSRRTWRRRVDSSPSKRQTLRKKPQVNSSSRSPPRSSSATTTSGRNPSARCRNRAALSLKISASQRSSAMTSSKTFPPSMEPKMTNRHGRKTPET